MELKHETSLFGEELLRSETVLAVKALFPEGDAEMFFAIKISFKLGPKKIGKRNIFSCKDLSQTGMV